MGERARTGWQLPSIPEFFEERLRLLEGLPGGKRGGRPRAHPVNVIPRQNPVGTAILLNHLVETDGAGKQPLVPKHFVQPLG